MRASPLTIVSVAGAACAAALVTFNFACGGDKSEPAPAATGTATGTPAAAGKAGEPAAAPPAQRGDEIRLFDFVDNRLLAHQLQGGGLVVTPGTGGLAKYVHFMRPKLTWSRNKKDGKRVGVADKYASLEVPLTQAQLGGKVTARLWTEAARTLEVKIGGKTQTTQTVAGWQTISVPLDGAKVGDNRVQFVSSKDGPTFDWIQFGGTPGGDDAPALYDEAAKALVLPEGGGLAYYVYVPDKGRLVGAVRGDGCKLAVEVTAENQKPVTGTLSGNGAVELGTLSGRIARVQLTTSGCKRALLSDAGIAVPGKTPVVQKPKKPKYVVFWIMDSLRADRVKPYNPKTRNATPAFEALAKRGAIFMRNYVQGNESRASHASMWTGTWVGTHRYIPGGEKGVKASFVTIDEVMKSAGFYTSGVSSNGYITKKNGFGTFDAYRNHIHDGGGVKGEDILKYAIASVDGKQDKPWFLYIGTIDTHVSWRAKEPWISQYSPGYTGKYAKEASGKDVELMATGKIKVTDAERQHIVAIYDSNVSYQDDLLGKFMKQLETWGIADDTMIIITADHGDEQWEDGRVGHGASLRESLEHVPLAIIYPPLFPAGLVQEGTETIDILPTIIDALGLSPSAEMQGESLIPLAQGVGRGYLRPSIASMYEGAWAMRLGDWKLRVPGNGNATVFNLGDDYYEKKDLADSRPYEKRFLTDAMSTFLVNQKGWTKREHGVANNMTGKAAAAFDR